MSTTPHNETTGSPDNEPTPTTQPAQPANPTPPPNTEDTPEPNAAPPAPPNTENEPSEPESQRNFKTFEELNAMADAGELTQASLQEELHKYQQAIAEEYATTSTKSENVEANTREFFKNNVQQAAAQIVHLAQNGETPNIRLKASEFIIKEAFAGARHDGDPIKDLLTELTTATPQRNKDKDESVISPQRIMGE